MEEYLFFKNRLGHDLFGAIHVPEQKIKGQCFIFCSPTFGEKTKTYRIFVNFARMLERNGYHVLRFDYFGEGDSSGNFEDADLTTRLADIEDAVHFFNNRFKGIKSSLLGLRLGASLAILAANKLTNIHGLVMWAPILDIPSYLFDFLRGNLSNQLLVHRKIILNREKLVEQICAGEAVNVDGWLVGKRFWDQAKAMDFELEFSRLKQQSLIVDFKGPQSLSSGINHNRMISVPNLKIVSYTPEFTFSDWKNYNPSPKILFEISHEWIERSSI